jgi:regulation of enolase protein 1 (concanavalin A-like superfamily)
VPVWARCGSSRHAGLKPLFRQACSRLLLAATVVLLGGVMAARAQLPSGWQDLDVGSPSLSGSASWGNGAWSVSGGGADIGSTSDQFNFAYETSSGSAVILAQVLTVQETDGSAKAGVMFRDDNTAGAMFAMVAVTPNNGLLFEWRNTTGGSSSAAQIAGIAPPVWVEVVRSGTNFAGYYSPDSQVWTPIAQAQTIPMNSLPLAGLGVTAHDNSFLCQATFNSVVVSNVPPPPPPSLGIYRQLWTNLNTSVGNTLTALTNTTYNTNWPNNPDPDYTKIFTTFETEINSGQNYYGQQLRTFVVPPTSGNYVFWIASDDNSDLFLSPDETPAHKALIAYVSSWTDSEVWTAEASQQSAPVYLQAGYRYYVEALMQQGGGGDNLAVRWQLPNGVFEQPMTASSPAGTWMIPYDGTVSKPGIYLQAKSFTLVEGQNASFFVLCTNGSALSYRWRLNGSNLSGAGSTNTALTLTNVTIATNNGQVYTCVITNAAGSVTSAPVTLTVLPDIVPPAVQRAASLGPTNFVIVFTKPVEVASATNSSNYIFTNGLPVTAASLSTDAVTVTLTTAPFVYGSNYCLVINNVRDRATHPNTIATNTLVRFTAMPYADLDIGNPPFYSTVTLDGTNGLDVFASGSDIGGVSDQFTYNYQLQSGNFDVCTRLAGLTPADTWAKAGWMARETLDPGARFAAALATPAMSGCFFEWRDPASSTANSAGAFPANYPNTWLRLQRSGNTFNGYASFDGQTWVLLGSDTISMPTQIYLGLAVSSHNSAQGTSAQFLNIASLTNAVTGAVVIAHEPIGPCSRRTAIVISEIMYKPAPRTDGVNLEFIELYNSNPWFQDLSGYQLTGVNMTYTFPPGTLLAGGAYLVVAASPQSIQSVYGITNVVGPYEGTLKHVDSLQLSAAGGGILLTVPYSNVRPWPVAADGTGHSIVLANPTYGEGDPHAWDISDAVGGSPGRVEAFHPSPLRNVVINEVLAHSENPAVPRFVELYNHSNQTNDLSGCILTDDTATNKCVLPSGTFIGPRGFLSFNESQLGFVLNGAGETVYLLKPDGSRVLDAMQFEAQADGVSYGRWPDGGGDCYPLASRTPGTNRRWASGRRSSGTGISHSAAADHGVPIAANCSTSGPPTRSWALFRTILPTGEPTCGPCRTLPIWR